MVALDERIQEGEADYYRRRGIYYALCAEILYGVPEMVSFNWLIFFFQRLILFVLFLLLFSGGSVPWLWTAQIKGQRAVGGRTDPGKSFSPEHDTLLQYFQIKKINKNFQAQKTLFPENKSIFLTKNAVFVIYSLHSMIWKYFF
jgi:hypothetical protein